MIRNLSLFVVTVHDLVTLKFLEFFSVSVLLTWKGHLFWKKELQKHYKLSIPFSEKCFSYLET